MLYLYVLLFWYILRTILDTWEFYTLLDTFAKAFFIICAHPQSILLEVGIYLLSQLNILFTLLIYNWFILYNHTFQEPIVPSCNIWVSQEIIIYLIKYGIE